MGEINGSISEFGYNNIPIPWSNNLEEGQADNALDMYDLDVDENEIEVFKRLQQWSFLTNLSTCSPVPSALTNNLRKHYQLLYSYIRQKEIASNRPTILSKEFGITATSHEKSESCGFLWLSTRTWTEWEDSPVQTHTFSYANPIESYKVFPTGCGYY